MINMENEESDMERTEQSIVISNHIVSMQNSFNYSSHGPENDRVNGAKSSC